jgi:hypothetical protein
MNVNEAKQIWKKMAGEEFSAMFHILCNKPKIQFPMAMPSCNCATDILLDGKFTLDQMEATLILCRRFMGKPEMIGTNWT